MKRYKSLFMESYFSTISVMGKNVDIYINPNGSERAKILNDYTAMRGIANEKGTILLWRGNAVHSDVIYELKKDSEFNTYFKGNHSSYEDRNYITFIIENDGLFCLGDGELIEEIRENDNINLLIMIKNLEKRNPWIKYSEIFKKEVVKRF